MEKIDILEKAKSRSQHQPEVETKEVLKKYDIP